MMLIATHTHAVAVALLEKAVNNNGLLLKRDERIDYFVVKI